MTDMSFPVIDLAQTGKNILRLRKAKGLSVKDLQKFFGFDEPQAIYKWQKGKSLPTVDNLFALSLILQTPMNEIIVQRGHSACTECPLPFSDRLLYNRISCHSNHFLSCSEHHHTVKTVLSVLHKTGKNILRYPNTKLKFSAKRQYKRKKSQILTSETLTKELF